jgi:hypothetical protein
LSVSSARFESMAQKFSIAYYYLSPQNAERLEAFRSLSGDSEKNLITQFVRGWLGRNRSYYLELARSDARSRHIAFKQWGEQVYDKGIESLPEYQNEIELPGENPLRDIVLTPDAIRRPLNYITLGVQNICLLRVGIHYDRDNAIGFISRIVKEHLDRNWDALYKSQVEAENFDNWK